MSTVPSAQERDEQAAAWCVELADGTLPPLERKAFDEWIGDPVNATVFEEAVQIWSATSLAAESPQIMQLRTAALESVRRTHASRWSRSPGPLKARLWVGATAALLIAAIAAALWLRTPSTTYFTGIGERRVVRLVDGSSLSLDADTSVEVQLSRRRRDLTLLKGRAKFDVIKDPLRPFTVAAGDRMVVATGTSFGVELLSTTLHVQLYEGRVVVMDRRKQDAPQTADPAHPSLADQNLAPGRELVALETTGYTTIENIKSDSLLWESGQFSFDDEPLPSAVERINRYARDQLIIGDAATAARRVNGVFTAGDTAAFVEALAELNKVRAERVGNQLILRSD
jgi:transmembrane sensor